MKINLETKYYYIVNIDLKMSTGKIAAQVSHVAMKLGQQHGEIGTAVVLKGREFQLTLLEAQKGVECIRDAGLTQVIKNSLTCVGFKQTPFHESFTKDLKLL